MLGEIYINLFQLMIYHVHLGSIIKNLDSNFK